MSFNGRIVLVLLAAAAVYLVGNSRIGLWDRDEPRYAQCSRQMLDSGDWVVPRLYDNLRAAKPPLIYWCQLAAMSAFGENAFAARVPSVLGMLATLIVLAIALRRQCGREMAFWTIFILSSSALAIMAAKICLTDSVLVLFTTIAQICLFLMWRGNRSWAVAIAMAAALGLGGITKGPFILGTVAATAAALGLFRMVGKCLTRRSDRRGREREPETIALSAGTRLGINAPVRPNDVTTQTFGQRRNGAPPGLIPDYEPQRHGSDTRIAAQVIVSVAIITAIVLPWIILVHHRSPEFLGRIFLEAREHLENGKEGHNFPPGFHLMMVWPMFLPWSLLLPMAIGIGIQNRRVPEVRFALAATLGPWLMVEFIGTKLAHYFLSAYPAIAFLTAYAIMRNLRRESRDTESRPFLIGAGFWAAAVAGIGGLPWLAARTFGLNQLPWRTMILLSLFTIAYGLVVMALLHARKLGPALLVMGGGMFVFMAMLCGLYFPNAPFLRISEHVAKVLKRQGATHKGDVLMVDYKEPSLGFYQGGTIRECKKDALLAMPFKAWPRWLVITPDVWEKMTLAERAGLRVIDRYTGWAYADRGRVLEVMVVEK
ncbi:MAG TPA: glycosyltransferase family 39 protein [Tepidisphaeraceae bacterium]|nr:glycosyltransferase family 39 protein [Tepidisphaeraceae bacterium]